MEEYHDGILLFELTDQKVWSRAVRDTTGSMNSGTTTNQSTPWKTRIDGRIFRCADAAAAERIEMVAKAGGDIETERREMVSENPLSITVEDRRLEEGINPVFDAALQELNGKPGITSMQEVDGQIRFVQIVEVVAPTGKTLDEARGKVIADYQDHLEKSWIAELRARYDVEVNTDALHAIR